MRETKRGAGERSFCDWEVLRMYTVLEVMRSGFIGVELFGYLIY